MYVRQFNCLSSDFRWIGSIFPAWCWRFIWYRVEGGNWGRSSNHHHSHHLLLYDGPTAVAPFTIPNFYPMSGKAGSFAVTKSQACLLWPAWGNDCDNQASISCAHASVTHFQRYCRCLFDISSIKTRLDLTNQRSALGRWLALSVVHCNVLRVFPPLYPSHFWMC